MHKIGSREVAGIQMSEQVSTKIIEDTVLLESVTTERLAGRTHRNIAELEIWTGLEQHSQSVKVSALSAALQTTIPPDVRAQIANETRHVLTTDERRKGGINSRSRDASRLGVIAKGHFLWHSEADDELLQSHQQQHIYTGESRGMKLWNAIAIEMNEIFKDQALLTPNACRNRMRKVLQNKE